MCGPMGAQGDGPKGQNCANFKHLLLQTHFHLFENTWLDFNQTWQEPSLGAGGSKLFDVNQAFKYAIRKKKKKMAVKLPLKSRKL